jgi:hypothetical protein
MQNRIGVNIIKAAKRSNVTINAIQLNMVPGKQYALPNYLEFGLSRKF